MFIKASEVLQRWTVIFKDHDFQSRPQVSIVHTTTVKVSEKMDAILIQQIVMLPPHEFNNA